MVVIEHEPYTYFLLRDGDEFYLDSNCDHGPVGYSVLVRLNDEEVRHYLAKGSVYVRDLAVGVHNSVPILRRGSEYAKRDIAYDTTIGKTVMDAIRAWQKQGTDGSESN